MVTVVEGAGHGDGDGDDYGHKAGHEADEIDNKNRAGAHWRTHAEKSERELCEWDAETYRAWMGDVEREKEEGDAKITKSGLGVGQLFLATLKYEKGGFCVY